MEPKQVPLPPWPPHLLQELQHLLTDFFFLLISCFVGQGPLSVAQVGLLIFLLQSPECWG